jgi:hypothetical protein
MPTECRKAMRTALHAQRELTVPKGPRLLPTVRLEITVWKGQQFVRFAARALRVHRIRALMGQANAPRVPKAAIAQSARPELSRARQGLTLLAVSMNAPFVRLGCSALSRELHQPTYAKLALKVLNALRVPLRKRTANPERTIRPQGWRLARHARAATTVRLPGALPLTIACLATPARSARPELELSRSAVDQASMRLKCRRSVSHVRLELLQQQ